MRYAVINNDSTLVYSVHEYDGNDWATFQAEYSVNNPGKSLRLLEGSTFPAGQGWTQDTDGIYPSDGEPKGLADVLPAIYRAIEFRTDQLQYSGTVTFKGHQFPRSHEVRDDVVLLANSVINNAAVAAALLPLRINAIDQAEVTIDTVAEANNFALAMLSSLKADYAGQADQIAMVKSFVNITQAILYVDPR